MKAPGTTGGDWRAISRQMRDEDAVFIVGVPRSGTSVLRHTLERHEAFRPRVPGAEETKVFSDPGLARRILDPEGARLLKHLAGDESAARRLLDDVNALDASLERIDRRLARRLVRTTASRRFRVARFRAEGGPHVARLFFHHARVARGTRRVLEKTPNHALFLDEMRATFPRMRAILCLRHPIDAYSSYRKRLERDRRRGVDEDKIAWLRTSPKRFSRKYVRWVDAMLAFERRHPDQAMRVRYEELTASPEETLDRVFAFVGETPIPHDDGEQPKHDRHGAPRSARTRIVENRKRWSDFLSAGEAERIESRVAATMVRLGYDRYIGSEAVGRDSDSSA